MGKGSLLSVDPGGCRLFIEGSLGMALDPIRVRVRVRIPFSL